MKQLTTIIIVLLLFYGCSDPKVGEIWVYQSDGYTDNPFDSNHKPFSDTLKILAVKKGYVQYVNIKTNIVDTYSIRWFKVGSHKIKTTNP